MNKDDISEAVVRALPKVHGHQVVSLGSDAGPYFCAKCRQESADCGEFNRTSCPMDFVPAMRGGVRKAKP